MGLEQDEIEARQPRGRLCCPQALIVVEEMEMEIGIEMGSETGRAVRGSSHEPLGPWAQARRGPVRPPSILCFPDVRTCRQEDSGGHKIFWRRGWRSTLFIGILPTNRPSERGTWARGQSTTISFVATDKKSLKTHTTAQRRTVDFRWQLLGIHAWRIQRLARRRHKR